MRKFVPLIVVIAVIALYETQFVDRGRGTQDGVRENTSRATGEAARELIGDNSQLAAADVVASARAVHGEIARGASFFVEMQGAGMSPGEIHRVVEASRKVFNFKKVRPGQKYAVWADSLGQLDSLHYAIDSEHMLTVRRAGARFEAMQDTISYRIEHYVTSGTIDNSIYATLQEQGSNPELASHLAVIFQWDIDFFTDIRRGDAFTLLYESKVYENGKTKLGDVLAARIFTQGREHYAFAYRTQAGSRSYYDARGNSLHKSLLRAPLRFMRISSNFTRRRLHPVTRTYRPHLGVDYVAPRGTPVRSTGDGTVAEATRNRANGKYVKIRHNSRYTTFYLHLSGFAKGIRRGSRVKQGQVIGYLGSTGLVTAPHLDYRIKVGGRFVNPRTVKLPSKRPVPSDEMELFAVSRDACLLRFFEASQQARTTRVDRPRPPMQNRMGVVL
ncbi:MAG: peptidoglycan DD-metalloendopeptidase family protein [Candidatus Krumholzibacteria bacterium]|nr:peptidoglycan DD-metalloendopeptidase family protein [Candidatus Krumholzibacteria bacterium]